MLFHTLYAIFNSVLQQIFYISLYIQGLGSFPKPLSPQQEEEYFHLFQNGDDCARKKLIEHNLRLVAHIVKKYYSATDEGEDLLSIGTIGLIKAVSTFSCDKGTRFATYASRCIENEILMYFRGMKKTAGDVFISDPIDTDKEGNTLTFSDIVADDSDIVEEINLRLESARLQTYMESRLSPREARIIRMRYGLGGQRPLPQREVAKILGISRSYVSRIETKALEILRKAFDPCNEGKQ